MFDPYRHIPIEVGHNWSWLSTTLPWVPEPQKLNERKIGKRKREKEERLSSLLSFFFSLFFGTGNQGRHNLRREVGHNLSWLDPGLGTT